MSAPTTHHRVIVGLSGGVDSAVTAHRLLEAGHHVDGLFMFNWQEDEDAYCTAADDFQDARRVAETLGIVLHRADFSADYRQRVFDYFLDEYAAGRTPNPDVLCNREIKFGVFVDYAKRLGADKVATGHYARLDAQHRLCKGADGNKDQSYFLHAVEPAAFEDVLFPLGELTKDQVRDLAWARGLPNHARKDSTGICFIGERPFAEFLGGFLPARPGPIETDDGQRVGTHQGLMYYTLGQRQGLGLGGVRGYDEAPWYVVKKRLESNTLIVGQDHQHSLLMSRALDSEAMHWLARPDATTFDCAVKTRYRQADQAATVRCRDDGTVHIVFQRAQRAVTPGQYVVLYHGDLCLGGAVIAATTPVSDAAEPSAVSVADENH
ncbi:MAG: tRNA 2-thiouridine(34) synthase MnmA [Pseudomonadota bacterium]